jgi:hypothetical protein
VLDLTLDEEHAEPWAAPTRVFDVIVDKAGVGARLRSDLASWQPPQFARRGSKPTGCTGRARRRTHRAHSGQASGEGFVSKL